MTTDPFHIRGLVPEFESWVAQFRTESAAAREDPGLEWFEPLRYGLDPAQEVLAARPRGPAPKGGWPLHVFVHGGYWRAFAPEDYTFLASAICALGAVAVLPGYRKMPRHRLGEVVADARAGLRAALAAAPGWDADPASVTASGHSAGAHLASFMATTRPGDPPPSDPPARLLLLSGIYDPEPLRRSVLQGEIGLAEEDCAWAPLAAESPRAAVTLVVGGAETAPFHEQARALAARWGASVLSAGSEDHMSIVHSLGVPGTAVHDALARVIGVGPQQGAPASSLT
jgi:arylformamidase